MDARRVEYGTEPESTTVKIVHAAKKYRRHGASSSLEVSDSFGIQRHACESSAHNSRDIVIGGTHQRGRCR